MSQLPCTQALLLPLIILTINACAAPVSSAAIASTPVALGVNAPSPSADQSADPSTPWSTCVDPASDVPTFRGDEGRTGKMPGPAPLLAPVERWRFNADGPLNSSPAVAAGTVFQGSAAGTLVALDLASGARLWSSRLSRPVSTPTVEGRRVVVGSGSGVALAFDRDSGALSWKTQIGGQILGAPAASGEGLALASTSGVVALIDPSDGRTVWRTKLDGRIARSPAIAAGVIVVPLEPGELAALDVASGGLLWRTTIASGGGVGTPAIDGGRVVTATGLDESNASDRAIVALDLRSGSLDWRWTSSTGSTVYSPALDGGRGYVVSEGGFAVALDVRTGMELWRSDLGASAEALAAVAGGSVLVASNRHDLVSLDAETGAAEWRVPITGVPYAPVVSCGWVLVPSNLGTLTVFGAPS